MNTVHFVLMGKGGIGKSLTASFLAQYLRKKHPNLCCRDTDPTNPTFSSYRALNAEHVNIMSDDMNINKSKFDQLLETIANHDGPSVIDNGASSFLPMMAYIMELEVMEVLRQYGKDSIIHAVLIGGVGMIETIRMLDVILQSQPAPVVIWENELFGPIVSEKGLTFDQSEIYQKYADRILGTVKIKQHSNDTYGSDMHKMTTNLLTFDEVKQSPQFGIANKQRLKLVEREINSQLDTIFAN